MLGKNVRRNCACVRVLVLYAYNSHLTPKVFSYDKYMRKSLFYLGKNPISGLKTFSNWPTYPQLYVNGELIGGLDILKEMAESGELDSLLPSAADINTR